jgi:ribosomal protein S12 methylthiotransferase accessory factor
VSFALVVGAPNDPVFEQVNERALAGGIPWLGVEIGSVGGHPLVEAAITGFSPDTGCYECLRRRVGSNLAKQTDNTPTPAAHTERLAGAIAAHAAARALKSDAPQVFGQIIEIPHSERRFQPVPNCRCGASPSTALQWDEGSRSTDEALARAERAVDEHVGIVQEVGEAESFPAPYYLARNCDTSGFSDGSASRQAAGVAADWDVAFMKALGEALERYSAGVFGRDSFQLASYQALDAALDPQSVVRPTDSLPSLDVAIPWVEGQRLDTREETSHDA